jgi:hypothetical protein
VVIVSQRVAETLYLGKEARDMTDRFGPASIDYRYNKAMGMPGTPEILTISGTSARSTALAGNAAYEFIADTDCFVLFQGGATDDATSANMLVLSGERLVYTTPAGSSYYVSAIQKSAGGKLYIAELSQDRIY